MSQFHRICHLKETPLVKIGDWVKRGQQIGLCGSSGNSSGPHAHYDIAKVKQPAWWSYTKGMSYTQVLNNYLDPTPYIKGTIPMANTFPMAGYRFMQWEYSAGLYHPGIDINGINDLGKPVYSPVEGRVVYVAGTTWIKSALGKLLRQDYNHGFGNFVVIEQAPNFDITKV